MNTVYITPDSKEPYVLFLSTRLPYKIVGWLDTFPSASDGKMRTTKVVLKKQKMLPYWSQNSLADTKLRKELGLD